MSELEKKRIATETRETRETKITATINLDGIGDYEIKTGDPMFDHLVEQLSRHSLIDINLIAEGDSITDEHHLIEDVSIMLGRLLKTALGDSKGIYRMGFALIPLDEVLARVSVDLSGRGYAVVRTELEGVMIGTFNGELKCSGALTISQSGRLHGNLWAKEIYINGRVDGDVHADKVRLDGEACLVGDVQAKALSVADGAVLHGVCNMQNEKVHNNTETEGVD